MSSSQWCIIWRPVPVTPLTAMTPALPILPKALVAHAASTFSAACLRLIFWHELSIILRLLEALIASCRTRYAFPHRRQERLPRSPFDVVHSRREPRHPKGQHKKPYHITNFGGKPVGVHIIGYQMFRCCVGCVCSLTCCRIRTPTISPRSNPSWPSNLQ